MATESGRSGDGQAPPHRTSVKLHYVDRFDEPRAGFVVSTIMAFEFAERGRMRRFDTPTKRFELHLANFIGRFREDVLVQRSHAEQPLFEESEFSTEPRTSYVEAVGEGCDWTLYRHTSWPLECAEVPLPTLPSVQVCVAGWSTDISDGVVPLLEVVNTDFARAFDAAGPDRRSLSR